jgi:PIN domain nuclease of toxin-antitoxin system
LVWYLLDSPRLSTSAARALDETASTGGLIHVSPVSIIEIIYLSEKGKLSPDVPTRVFHVLREPETDLAVVPLDGEVARAVADVPRDLVPDMPDRIIAATALHLNLPLVTRDQRIRRTSIQTIW